MFNNYFQDNLVYIFDKNKLFLIMVLLIVPSLARVLLKNLKATKIFYEKNKNSILDIVNILSLTAIFLAYQIIQTAFSYLD